MVPVYGVLKVQYSNTREYNARRRFENREDPGEEFFNFQAVVVFVLFKRKFDLRTRSAIISFS